MNLFQNIRYFMKKDMVYKLNEEERMLVLNPQSVYKIRPGDALFVIAENKPASL